jgi:type II secretory pathway component GspD/PulD (secretin)
MRHHYIDRQEVRETMNQTKAMLLALLLGASLALPAPTLSAQSSNDAAAKPSQPPAVKAPAPGDLTRRIEELEKQVARLNREVEQLKAAPNKPAAQEQKADFEIIQLKAAPVKDVHPLIGDLFRGRTSFSIAADGNTNSLIVRGSAADIASVRKLVQHLDSADSRAEPPNPVVKTFPLKHIKAELMARLIQQLLKDSQVRVAVAGDRTLVVYASPTRLLAIQDLILKIDVLPEKETPK